MVLLSKRDLEKYNAAVIAIHSIHSVGDFVGNLISALRMSLKADIYTADVIHAGSGSLVCSFHPHNALPVEINEAVHHYFWQHPSMGQRHGAAECISDYLPQQRWHRLGFYNETYRKIGGEDELAMDINLDDGIFLTIGAHHNKRGFAAEERLKMSLLRPHILAAYRKLHTMGAITDPAKDVTNGGFLLVTPEGRVARWSDGMRKLMEVYSGGKAIRGELLPEPVRAWFHTQRRGQESPLEINGPPADLTLRREATTLTFHFFPNMPAGAGEYLVLAREHRRRPAPGVLEPMGLSVREQEVLAWVIEGKTNFEIAKILGISPGTVKRHLENLYGKLGVENRVAAARMAMHAAQAAKPAAIQKVLTDGRQHQLEGIGVYRRNTQPWQA